MDVPPTLAQQLALTQQDIALAVIKSNAQAQQGIANILSNSLSAGASTRGGNVDTSA